MNILLARPHTHAGRDYPPGASLDLDADAAAWLIALGVASPAPTSVTAVVPELVPLKSPAPKPARPTKE